MKTFSPIDQSSVVNVLGLFALDHLFLFCFVFIFVSLFLWIPKLGIDQVLTLLKIAHSINQTQLLKQEIAKTHM